MFKLSPSEQFAENLYRENLRAFHELEAMRYGIMARLGFSEPDALELAVAIVAADGRAAQAPRNAAAVEIDEVMAATTGRVPVG
jgi:hypothetical protein